MQILQGMKRVVQLICDREMYSLAWIAAKNELKRPQASASQVPQAEQKKAKAVNGK